jgi:acyl carrier protein
VTAPLTLPEFTAHIASTLGVDPGDLRSDVDLRAELQLDSIQMFLLLVAIEDLGIVVPEQLYGQLRTVEDAYHHYVTVSQHDA